MVTFDHHDVPVSENAAPKKFQRTPFAPHPFTPLPSSNYYTGEFSDKNYNDKDLDSEDKQPENTPDQVLLQMVMHKLQRKRLSIKIS